MDWEHRSYEEIGNELVDGHSICDIETATLLFNTYKTKYNELSTKVDKMTDNEYAKYINQSDDGLSDLLAHIIGMGKEDFESIQEPKDFLKYTNEVRESFAYSFHPLYDLLDE